MKQLHKLGITLLSHAETGQLIKRNVADLVTAAVDVTTDTHIQVYNQKMISDSVLFDLALLQIQKNEETAVLAQLDHNRDIAFTILNRQINVYELSNVPAEISAYKPLRTLMATFKNTPRLNYEAETNTITNLVQDLTNVNYAPHVTMLQLGNYVTRLSTANTSFDTLFSTRNTEVASTVVYDAKAIRLQMILNYKAYVNYVLSLSIAANTPYYNGILDIVNTIRKYYSDLLARRHGGVIPGAGTQI